MSQDKTFLACLKPAAAWLLYAGTTAVFIWIFSQYYLPGKGFTYLIEFGDQSHANYLPELRAVNHFELHDSPGYDAQQYAQIAMRPHLGDPVLARAVDNLPYRARRILFCWTAYALAGGNPVKALHIYAVQNLVSWFLLAALLLRWFPPASLNNWVRWAGVLASFGLCVSVRGSLVDGPSLLLIAAGVALFESGRPWLAAALLGIAGLGKETNLLANVSLVEPAGKRRWRTVAWLGLAVLPLAVWLVVLRAWLRGSGWTGLRNLAPPFFGYFARWAEIARGAASSPYLGIWPAVLVQVSLTAQWLFLATRPRTSDAWWRVGAAFGVLMVFLGGAVWEGYPGAAARVLLPMTLAFNVLVPRGRGWWAVLLLGNLSAFVSADTLYFPGRESYVTTGPRDLRIIAADGRIVEAIFDKAWYPPGKSWLEYWRWSDGPASVTFRNPHPFPVTADISFGLRADDPRTVTVSQGGREIWRADLVPEILSPGTVRGVTLPPGDTVWRFDTDKPPIPAKGGEPQPQAFSLRNLKIHLIGPDQ